MSSVPLGFDKSVVITSGKGQNGLPVDLLMATSAMNWQCTDRCQDAPCRVQPGVFWDVKGQDLSAWPLQFSPNTSGTNGRCRFSFFCLSSVVNMDCLPIYDEPLLPHQSISQGCTLCNLITSHALPSHLVSTCFFLWINNSSFLFPCFSLFLWTLYICYINLKSFSRAFLFVRGEVFSESPTGKRLWWEVWQHFISLSGILGSASERQCGQMRSWIVKIIEN